MTNSTPTSFFFQNLRWPSTLAVMIKSVLGGGLVKMHHKEEEDEVEKEEERKWERKEEKKKGEEGGKKKKRKKVCGMISHLGNSHTHTRTRTRTHTHTLSLSLSLTHFVATTWCRGASRASHIHTVIHSLCHDNM